MNLRLLACLAVALLPAPALASGFDLYGVTFRPGHPTSGKGLETSVANPGELERLAKSIDLLKRYPSTTFAIHGHVDQYECAGVDACRALGLRRAVLVYRHLIAGGVDPKQVLELREYGFERGIASSVADSARNPRVELNLQTEP